MREYGQQSQWSRNWHWSSSAVGRAVVRFRRDHGGIVPDFCPHFLAVRDRVPISVHACVANVLSFR
ncbi:hypothetical protein KIN20_002373 [Parelaphostrongylus tenuis]|uniref:Uncharacterized protein n=1 Tax=Parelaphostrongylus tenuis TaxID=148309 RepID=A0AAD5QDH8_PARTN|nr:hypothetical protein KIN20_002373 [Parelaphostrongylus tenuis]